MLLENNINQAKKRCLLSLSNKLYIYIYIYIYTRAKRIVIIFESVDGVIIFFLKVKGWIPKFLDSCKSHEQESRVFVLNQWNSFLEGEESD
jgi:hypothetical protein